nr:MAG TPA: hypothetical protein [Crassvirales sp.]
MKIFYLNCFWLFIFVFGLRLFFFFLLCCF